MVKTKKTKVEEYYSLLHYIVAGQSNLHVYLEYVYCPDLLNWYLDGYNGTKKEETRNIWEEVITYANKQANIIDGSVYNINVSKKKEINKHICEIARARLDFIQGKPNKFLSNDIKKRFIRNIESYKQFFSVDAINHALSKMNVSNWWSKKEVYGNFEYYEQLGWIETGDCCRDRIVKEGGYKRQIVEHGKIYLAPDEYQLEEKQFILDCMYYDYPYMKKYDIKVYHMDKPFEFYVEVKNKGTLYIPYICLKDKTIIPAVERMTEYFTWYYKDKGKLEEQLGLMRTNVFRSLKKDIENKK